MALTPIRKAPVGGLKDNSVEKVRWCTGEDSNLAVQTGTGEDRSEFVVTTTGRTPWSGFSKLKAQIDKQVAAQIAEEEAEPMATWTMHDLRRSLVTGMNDRGLAPPHIIEANVERWRSLRVIMLDYPTTVLADKLASVGAASAALGKVTADAGEAPNSSMVPPISPAVTAVI